MKLLLSIECAVVVATVVIAVAGSTKPLAMGMTTDNRVCQQAGSGSIKVVDSESVRRVGDRSSVSFSGSAPVGECKKKGEFSRVFMN